jgi:hypothetical protein
MSSTSHRILKRNNNFFSVPSVPLYSKDLDLLNYTCLSFPVIFFHLFILSSSILYIFQPSQSRPSYFNSTFLYLNIFLPTLVWTILFTSTNHSNLLRFLSANRSGAYTYNSPSFCLLVVPQTFSFLLNSVFSSARPTVQEPKVWMFQHIKIGTQYQQLCIQYHNIEACKWM